jgi:hypothetical protein
MRCTVFLAAVLCLPAFAEAQSVQQQGRPGWPCAGAVDPTYVRTAEATGGKVLLFHPTELEGWPVDMRASREHPATVLRAVGPLAEGLYEFTVPVDTSVESLYFFVSVQCLQVVTVATPGGQELSGGVPGVDYHQFESVRLYIVNRPASGAWKITAVGRGLFSVIVTAKAALGLDGVTLRDAAGPIRSGALGGRSVALEVDLTGATRQVAFQFVSAGAAALKPLQLHLAAESGPRRSYAGLTTTPTTDFRLVVTGQDANGYPFQRFESRLFPGGTP